MEDFSDLFVWQKQKAHKNEWSVGAFPLPFKLPKLKLQTENKPQVNTSIAKIYYRLYTIL